MHSEEELKLYASGTWSDLEYNRSARENIIPIILNLFNRKIESVIDFGCGCGSWLEVCKQNEITNVLGLDLFCPEEYLRIDKNEFVKHDISKEYNNENKYDLVISIETAEHIESEYKEVYINNLVKSGDIILFSAAIPGQWGIHHVNCNWLEYWVKMFNDRGFDCIDIRYKWWGNNYNIPPIYKQNVVLFVSKDYLKINKWLYNESVYMGSVIHPGFYSTVVNYCINDDAWRIYENIS
jgi:hypothetical protein